MRRHEDIGYLDAAVGLVALGAIHESMRGMGEGAVGKPPVHHLRRGHDGVPSPGRLADLMAIGAAGEERALGGGGAVLIGIGGEEDFPFEVAWALDMGALLESEDLLIGKGFLIGG